MNGAALYNALRDFAARELAFWEFNPQARHSPLTTAERIQLAQGVRRVINELEEVREEADQAAHVRYRAEVQAQTAVEQLAAHIARTLQSQRRRTKVELDYAEASPLLRELALRIAAEYMRVEPDAAAFPPFLPFEDLVGLYSQLSNICAGLVRQRDEALETAKQALCERDAARESLREDREASHVVISRLRTELEQKS